MVAHVLYQCPPDCERPRCPIHEGGLASCTVCGGAEGSLPKDCPGVSMTPEQEDAVYDGNLDFVNGVWVELRQPAGQAFDLGLR